MQKIFKLVFVFNFALSFAALFSTNPSLAENLDNKSAIVLGANTGLYGKRISKSSVVRLANITEGKKAIPGSSMYLPAGHIILVTRNCKNLGLNWCLAITEGGMPLFVRVNGVHYKKIPQSNDHPKLIVAREDGIFGEREGKHFEYFASRFYFGNFNENGEISIVADSNKGQQGYKIGDLISIEDRLSNFSIIDINHFNQLTNFPVIRPIAEGELINTIIDSFKDIDLTENERKKIVKLFTENNLVNSKKCDSTITVKKGIDAETGVDLDKFWSAIKLKLGVTASYSESIDYKPGVEFQARRYIKENKAGELRFYEAWLKERREDKDCNKDISSVEIVAVEDSELGGQEGSITTKSAKSLKLDVSETNKIPRYSCAREYHKLIEHLHQSDGQLSRETAEIVIAFMLRYSGGENARKCKEKKTS